MFNIEQPDDITNSVNKNPVKNCNERLLEHAHLNKYLPQGSLEVNSDSALIRSPEVWSEFCGFFVSVFKR